MQVDDEEDGKEQQRRALRSKSAVVIRSFMKRVLEYRSDGERTATYTRHFSIAFPCDAQELILEPNA